MLVTIINRDGKSTPASQRGICLISAIRMGGKQDPSAAKSSGDGVGWHTKAKRKKRSMNRAGGIFRRGVTLSRPAQADWGETQPPIASDFSRRRLNVMVPKDTILIGDGSGGCQALQLESG
jgi:hypothetical protein